MVVLFVVLNLAFTGWVATDAARRGRNWFAWAMLVSLTGIIGFVLWLNVRRRWPAVVERLGAGRSIALASTAIPLLLLTAIITAFITTFVFQVARVEGRAMMPTIDDNDRVIVNKVAYRIGEPHVWDIVIKRITAESIGAARSARIP